MSLFESRKVKELLEVKKNWKDHYSTYSPNVHVDDYTYGTFSVMEWDNLTKLNIGKFCSIAEGVTFVLGGEHRSDFVSTYPFNALLNSFNYIKGHPHTKGDINIGNDVWIGRGATILSGVTVGDGAIIGANSVVTKNIEPYSIYAGNPAKFIRYRFEKEIIDKLENIKWWNCDEKIIAKIVPLLQSDDINNNIDKIIKIARKK